MTLLELITEAKAAYHQLMIGRSVVEVTDQNGEKIRYNTTNAGLLAQYIISLQAQIDAATQRPLGPMQFWGRS